MKKVVLFLFVVLAASAMFAGNLNVTNATGFYMTPTSSETITGVVAVGDPAGAGFAYNNLLSFPSQPYVDLYGILFNTTGTPVNLFNDNGYVTANYSFNGGAEEATVGFTLTKVNGSTYHFFSLPNADGVSFDGTLTATPEPSTLLMLSSGVIGLAGFVRRKL
jgi:hypothetical protein